MRTLKAFTLIELLVAVAIIAVLVAVLLPAISAAKEQGKEAVCLSNLRQWSLILMNYRNEYNDVLLPHQPPWFGGWEWHLAHLGLVTADNKIIACPKLRQIKNSHNEVLNATYVSNGYLWGNNSSGCLNGKLSKVTTIPEDSIMMAEMEHVFAQIYCENINAFQQGPGDGWGVSWLHRNSANFLFLDGHGAWKEKTGAYDWPYFNPPDPGQYDLFKRYWWVSGLF
jgi:prepilin-type N-terminal cleavage/methylation domain-containing protein/prepilin-type processing-associated H-X9-DG protein